MIRCCILACAGLLAAAESSIVTVQGRPTLAVDGQPIACTGYNPVSFDKGWHDQQVPRMAPAGLRLWVVGQPSMGNELFWEGDSILAEPAKPDRFPSMVDNLDTVVKADPSARIVFRYGGIEPDSWKKQHPEELFVTAAGARLPYPSLASVAYRTLSAASAAAIVRFYSASVHGPRIVAWADFQRTEGTHEPTVLGHLVDHSEPMKAAWKEFLAKRYTDDVMLVAAHGTGSTLADPLLPSEPHAGKSFIQAGATNGRLRDYLMLQGELFRAQVSARAAAVRAISSKPIVHDCLKIPQQGWNIRGFFDPSQGDFADYPEHIAASGMTGAAALFSASGFDGLITPHDYQARGLGDPFEPEGAADSAVLRGKLMLVEADVRSYASGESAGHYGAAKNIEEWTAIQWRNTAAGLTRGFWPYHMDLYTDWYKDPAMLPVLKRINAVTDDSLNWTRSDVPGIGVVIDDSAAQDTDGTGRVPYHLVMEQVRTGLARCGVPYRIYLLDDLALPNLPAHRVWYLPNLFRIDPARRTLLKRLQRDGATIVWGPLSGVSDGVTVGKDAATSLTGFDFAFMPSAYARRGSWIGGEGLAAALPAGTMLGDGMPFGPQLWPLDGSSLAHAWTQQGWSRSLLAVKPQDGWTSVFSASLTLPAPVWRSLARNANAHVWCDRDDAVVMAGGGVVALHAATAGIRVLHLPAVFHITDVVHGAELPPADHINVTTTGPHTAVYRLTKL